MASYDSNVIQNIADSLYSRAATIVFLHVAFFLLVGAVAGGYAGGGVAALVGGIVGALLGYYLGAQRAFMLKLQAQVALCQVQIEKNTRESQQRNERLSPDVESTAALTTMNQGASTAVQNGPLGTCPNCKVRLPVTSEACPICKAVFTEGSTWKVVPH